MVIREGLFRVEGGGDWNGQFLRKFDELRARLRIGDAPAGNDHGPLCAGEQLNRFPHARQFRLWAKRRHPHKLIFDDDVQLRFGFCDVLPDKSLKIQMHRAGRARDGFPKCLTQKIRQLLERVHVDAVFCDRAKRALVIDFLIRMPMLVDLRLPSGNGDHRRAREIGVLQARREVGRADRLGHANAGASTDAGVRIRHVRSGFFAVCHNAFDAQIFHFIQRLGRDDGHKKNVGNAVSLKGFGDEPAAGHFGHGVLLIAVLRRAIDF